MEPKEKKGLNKDQKEVILGSIIAGIAVFGGFYIYRKGFKRGVEIAAVISFEETLKWLDQEFPHVDAMKLWVGWKELHPEKVRTIIL